MQNQTPQAIAQREQGALKLAMAGNLFMAIAGVTAAMISNSQAVMLDGLFSLVGFTAALVGIRISANASAGPDKARPFGYAADESIFTAFRALSLLGLVLFASINAIGNIAAYFNGADAPEIKFAPLITYFVVTCATCAGLWFFHWNAWRKTGRVSEILQLESRSFAFDGAITAAAGLGMVLVNLLKDSPMAYFAPIGDSVIVLFLCLFAISPYVRSLVSGIGELAGVTAAPEFIAKARRAVRATLVEADVRLVDVSVVKTGRMFHVVLFVEPANPITAAEMDTLDGTLYEHLADALGQVELITVPSQFGRARQAE